VSICPFKAATLGLEIEPAPRVRGCRTHEKASATTERRPALIRELLVIRIGADFGGTKIEVAALDANDNFIARMRAPNPGSYDAAIKTVCDLFAAAQNEAGEQSTIGVQKMPPAEFFSIYAMEPGYPRESNEWFTHVGRVPAKWNRCIFFSTAISFTRATFRSRSA
jgi:hypothetical protein